MEEISNKTLATLLVVAIVISLAGTFFAMRGTSVISKTITGYAPTDVGEAKVNITETISITLNTDSEANFGAGYRNGSDPNVVLTKLCNLTTSTANPSCWYNESAWEYPISGPRDMKLMNDGNVYVNVTINSSINTTFISGTKASGAPDPIYMYFASNYTEGSDTGGCGGTLVDSETSFTNERQALCTRMYSEDVQDEINISIKIGIPQGITGNKSTSVDFLAEVVS